jgi:glutamate synthase domain-containing protein 2
LKDDGKIRKGFDVVVEEILGEDEFGFRKENMIVLGCNMMRK